MPGPRSRTLFFKLLATATAVISVAFAVATGSAVLVGRRAIDHLVRENLEAEAREVLERVEGLFTDRIREVESWSSLSLMDDVLLQDRAMNIENFVLDLKQRRPFDYEEISVLDRAETVVASTDVRTVGKRFPGHATGTRPGPEAQMSVSGPPQTGRPRWHLSHPIVSRLAADPIGWVVARASWREVERIVAGEEFGARRLSPERFVLLVDSRNRVLAGHPKPTAVLGPGAVIPQDQTAPVWTELVEDLDQYVVAFSPWSRSGPDVPAIGMRTVALWRKDEAFAGLRFFVATGIASALLGLALAAGSSFLIAGGITRRLRQLLEGTDALARGDLTFRADEGPQDEIGRLARSFNFMVAEIEKARAGLEDALARWKALVTHAPDIIMTLDREGSILFINRVLPGYDIEKVIGSSVYDYAPAEHHAALREAIGRVFSSGEAVQLDVEGIGPAGGALWYATRLGPVRHGESVAAVTLITTDITDRKRLEQEVVEISELERKRIGQDLHDGLGQTLAGIALLSKGLEKRLARSSPADAEEVRRIEDRIGEAIYQTRALAKGLFPVTLENEGLPAAIEELARTVSQTFHVPCEVSCELETPIEDRSKCAHLFRIVQEAVSNSIRHGKAGRIRIALRNEPQGHVLIVADDGVGFPGDPEAAAGMGLRTMRYRADVIGGTLEIRAGADGTGTLVTCHFS